MQQQSSLPFEHEKVIDLFAGGGGVSEAISLELGREPDVAVNHDEWAIALHAVNHPNTQHYREDVYSVDPLQSTRGQPVGLLHASPDCTHFSQAKGGQPRSREIRSLAWVVRKWAGKVRPRVITLENVLFMTQWTSLVAKRDRATGRVVKIDGTVAARGEHVPLREQFLIPNKKKIGKTWRSFINALRGLGYVVEWKILKASDFGAGTTRERLFMMARCDGQPIRWPTPTHGKSPKQRPPVSAAESIDFSIHTPSIFDREKPLVPATLRRIATGCHRFILDAKDPFILPIKTENAEIMSPSLVQLSYGERKGQRPRCLDIREPLGTVVAGGIKHGLVTAHLKAANDRVRMLGFLEQANTGMVGHDLRDPMSTIIGKGCTQRLITAHTVKLKGSCRHGQSIQEPLHTIAAQGEHHALIQYELAPQEEAGALRVARFLRKYYDEGKPKARGRMTREALLASVTVMIKGEPFVIISIGMRMLTPRELATAQGFRRSYVIERTIDGRAVPRTRQVKMVGNSVSPHPYRALLRANFPQEVRYQVAA